MSRLHECADNWQSMHASALDISWHWLTMRACLAYVRQHACASGSGLPPAPCCRCSMPAPARCCSGELFSSRYRIHAPSAGTCCPGGLPGIPLPHWAAIAAAQAGSSVPRHTAAPVQRLRLKRGPAALRATASRAAARPPASASSVAGASAPPSQPCARPGGRPRHRAQSSRRSTSGRLCACASPKASPKRSRSSSWYLQQGGPPAQVPGAIEAQQAQAQIGHVPRAGT